MPISRAEAKLLELGLAAPPAQDKRLRAAQITGPVSPRKRLTFKLYFPRPPYNGALYHAAFANGLYNFVGLVLGHQGTTIQTIQRESGCRVEIHDKDGNLNGDHPSAADPTLHALIVAEAKENLDKAVDMLLDTLAPINTDFYPIKVTAGGSAVLEASVHAKPPPPPTINTILTTSAKKSLTPNTSTTPTHTSSPAGAANAASVWAGRENNPLLSSAKSASSPKSVGDGDEPTGGNDSSNSNSNSVNSFLPLDSHRSSASGLSVDDVGTPTSREGSGLNGGLVTPGGLVISPGEHGLRSLNNNNNNHVNHIGHVPGEQTHQQQTVVPEFSLWHPFAAGGLLDDLHQSLSPEPSLNEGNGLSLQLAPFPGIGSWDLGGQPQQVIAASPRLDGAYNPSSGQWS